MSRAFRSAVLAVVALLPAAAAAETLTCTSIDALPYTIASSGHYCLNANFSQAFAASAITISANNVVLDCNDHVVTQTGATLVNGINGANRSLVTIRNCGLVGFNRAISLSEGAAGASRNNRILGNEIRQSRMAGINIAGTANLVEGNRIAQNTGTGTVTYGILVSSFGNAGVGTVVRNNIVTHFAPTTASDVVGIYLLDVANTAVLNNTISALFAPTGFYSRGIIGSSTVLGTAAVGNNVLAPTTGTPPGTAGGFSGPKPSGIRFEAVPTASSRNVCRANVVGHYTTNILVESASNGCVKASNTEF